MSKFEKQEKLLAERKLTKKVNYANVQITYAFMYFVIVRMFEVGNFFSNLKFKPKQFV